MTDVLVHPEAPSAPEHVAIYRKDYCPPDWLVPEVSLDLELDPDRTRVRSTLKVERNGGHDRPIRLAGDGLTPLSVRVDGNEPRWTMDGGTLVIEHAGAEAVVETEVEIVPAANNKLMGLYASGGNLCTQCESEGFRRIAFHPDRPDVLSRYKVRMSADKARFPILLANGNLVASGDADDGRHPETAVPHLDDRLVTIEVDQHHHRRAFADVEWPIQFHSILYSTCAPLSQTCRRRLRQQRIHVVGDDDAVVYRSQPTRHDNAHAPGVVQSFDLLR